jgi:hypothetical protein|tara:strand:+ start:98 stop:256 length:159 start_codon:yes stop_codon:yes gene_type:complete
MLMMKFVIGVVVGISISTWGVGGVTNMITQGVNYIQDGAKTVEKTVTAQGSN